MGVIFIREYIGVPYKKGAFTLLIYCTLNKDSSIDFEYIYNKHHHTVYGIIYRVVNDRGLAEDAMQESFFRFYNTMGKMQTEDDMRNWLYKIAKNTALDCIDKEGNYRKRVSIWLDDDDFVSEFLDRTAKNPLDEALKNALAKEISDVLDTLKPIHSNVIRLKYYFGYTTEEIAELTNAPLQTVYSRLEKAQSLLFDKLQFLKDDCKELIGGVFDEKK
jgi:RNA polymerase sigma-70 factor (ECF subfamily)